MSTERPEDIEERLHHDRAEIREILDALERRLSPGQLLDHALNYVKTNGGEVASSFGRSVKENPWPLVLSGIGLTWLIASSGSTRKANDGRGEWLEPLDNEYLEAYQRAQAAGAAVQREPDEEETSFQARVTEAKARTASLQREASESAEAFRDRVDGYLRNVEAKATALRERAASATRRSAARAGESLQHGLGAVSDGARAVSHRTREAQRRARELYQAEPLVAGAIGVMAGALLGALFPTTRVEDRALGDYGERVRQAGADIAADAARGAQEVAAEATHAAAQAADERVRRAATGATKPVDQ